MGAKQDKFLPDSAFRSTTYYSVELQSPVQHSNIKLPTHELQKELRTRVSPLNQEEYSGSQGQVCSVMDNEKVIMGSGVVCVLSEEPLRVYLLTCAHNFKFRVKGIQPKWVNMVQSTYHYSKDGPSKYNVKSFIQSSEYHLFPGYSENPEITSGCDIAVGLLQGGDYSHQGISKNSKISTIEKSNAQVGDVIMVIGYPVEKNQYLYKMEGTIYRIIDTPHGKLILYKDLSTTGGQSGCPVYVKRGDMWLMIGIHVGYDPSVEANVATALTNEIFTWMSEVSSKHSK